MLLRRLVILILLLVPRLLVLAPVSPVFDLPLEPLSIQFPEFSQYLVTEVILLEIHAEFENVLVCHLDRKVHGLPSASQLITLGHILRCDAHCFLQVIRIKFVVITY